jgi:hemerythrin-like domain-containing protein
MNSTETLRREHRWIRRLLDCLEELAHRAESRGQLDAIASADLLSVFEDFIDQGHQEKEERFFFRALLDKADASQSAYVRRLFKDHKEERHDLESLRVHMLGAVHADPQCVREFVHRARAYAVAQRRHLAHEEVVLIPMAERLLGPLEDRRVSEGFLLVPSGGPEIRERVDALCKRLGLETAAGTA